MLNTEDLLTAAREQSGLSDFGDPSFREGLDVLVEAWNHEAKLTLGGMGRVAASTVATLVNRLKVEDYVKANPQLLDAPIAKPTFVFGLPRTGTTVAINLLTADPASRAFLRWEALNPVASALSRCADHGLSRRPAGDDPARSGRRARLERAA